MSGPDDRLLEEFLVGEGTVRAAYVATASAQPPAALDAAILQLASQAAAPTPQRRPARARWQLPMATAATLMLSLGVFLQVQRDPVAQQQVLAPQEQSVPAAEAVADAPRIAQATPPQEASKIEKKQAPVAVAKPKAPAAASPPPPPPAPATTAMSDAAAAPAPVTAAPPVSPAAAMAQAVEEIAASSDRASESRQRQEGFAAAPMAKASRAAPMANLMAQAESDSDPAVAIEQWAQHCGAEAIRIDSPTSWRGLSLAAMTRQADGSSLSTALRFAPDVSREAVTTALGPLAARASLSRSDCATRVTRELRESDAGWALVCECLAPATLR